MFKNNYLISHECPNVATFLGVMAVSSLAVFVSPDVYAAPLDYEIGNASVRSCKLVYSDGRPDEPLASCEGTKDFGAVTTSFEVKMVLTNEINQDVESASIEIRASANSLSKMCLVTQRAYLNGKTFPPPVVVALITPNYGSPAYSLYTTYSDPGSCQMLKNELPTAENGYVGFTPASYPKFYGGSMAIGYGLWYEP